MNVEHLLNNGFVYSTVENMVLLEKKRKDTTFYYAWGDKEEIIEEYVIFPFYSMQIDTLYKFLNSKNLILDSIDNNDVTISFSIHLKDRPNIYFFAFIHKQDSIFSYTTKIHN